MGGRSRRSRSEQGGRAWLRSADRQARAAPRASPRRTRPLLPLREQVYEALSLLQVPAAPRLIATVHEAFFATTFSTVRLTSLRRDEERSFRTAPFTRPYYICAALTADFLTPPVPCWQSPHGPWKRVSSDLCRRASIT